MKLSTFGILLVCLPSFAQVCSEVAGFEFCKGDTILSPGGLTNKLSDVYEQNGIWVGVLESVTVFEMPTGVFVPYNLRHLGTTKYCGPGVLAKKDLRVNGYSNPMRCIGYYPLAQNVAFEPLNKNVAIPRAVIVHVSDVVF